MSSPWESSRTRSEQRAQEQQYTYQLMPALEDMESPAAKRRAATPRPSASRNPAVAPTRRTLPAPSATAKKASTRIAPVIFVAGLVITFSVISSAIGSGSQPDEPPVTVGEVFDEPLQRTLLDAVDWAPVTDPGTPAYLGSGSFFTEVDLGFPAGAGIALDDDADPQFHWIGMPVTITNIGDQPFIPTQDLGVAYVEPETQLVDTRGRILPVTDTDDVPMLQPGEVFEGLLNLRVPVAMTSPGFWAVYPADEPGLVALFSAAE